MPMEIRLIFQQPVSPVIHRAADANIVQFRSFLIPYPSCRVSRSPTTSLPRLHQVATEFSEMGRLGNGPDGRGLDRAGLLLSIGMR